MKKVNKKTRKQKDLTYTQLVKLYFPDRSSATFDSSRCSECGRIIEVTNHNCTVIKSSGSS